MNRRRLLPTGHALNRVRRPGSPARLIVTAIALANLACGLDRIAPSPGSTKPVDETTARRESARELIVAHVVAETGLRAGMPAAFPNVVSVQDWDDRDIPFAVVDGVPMTWYRRGDNTKPPATHDQCPRVRTLQGN